MKSHGFVEIDHTADLALRVRGNDFHDLLAQAAKGFYYLLETKSKKGSSVDNSFSIKNDTSEAMLVDFLNELLYLSEYKKEAYYSFSFTEDSEKLKVEADGEKLESIGRNIKAVTFHDIDVQKVQNGVETTVTFDV